MTESASRPGPDQSDDAASVQSDDHPPFRYDARLADEIERHWQEYWRAEGTFNAPNPSGPLSEGFDAGRRPAASSSSWTCSPTPAAPGCM